MRPARIAVFGLGKVGSVMAAVHAAAGNRVTGCDLSPDLVAAVNDGRAPVPEPGLQERMDAGRERLTATDDPAEAVAEADASLIIVPTPSGDDGAFVDDHVVSVVRSIGAALRGDDRDHLVVVKSTVMPGACRERILPALEEAAGRAAGDGLALCYSPEFIALGDVVRGMERPDFLLLGASHPAAGERLESLARTVVGPDVPAAHLDLGGAEVTKLAVNAYVTTKITFANLLAQLCEGVPGADPAAVSDAVGLDPRIGRAYLSGGTPFGGPCFPRDNRALVKAAQRAGADFPLAETVDRTNRDLLDRLVDRADDLAGDDGEIAVLGLAYKPGTPVLEEAAGAGLAAALADRGRTVRVWDPVAGDAARAELGARVHHADSLDEACRRAAVVVITLPDPAYRGAVRHVDADAVLMDPWGVAGDGSE